jgi:Na+/proline symporter
LFSARWLSVFAIAASFGLALMNSSLGDVYNVSSAVLSACVAVPALCIFWKRANAAGVISGSVVGFIVTIGVYWFETKINTDGHGFPAFMQGTWGYFYLLVSVLASAVTLVAVSLLTRAPEAKRLAAVKAAPVDDVAVFLQESYETGA